MDFPFELEDHGTANYWIVRWLQWERNKATTALTQRLYQGLLDGWLELCRNAKEEWERSLQEKSREARRAGTPSS